MKTRPARQYWIKIVVAAAAVCVCAPALRADWGSLRANNRGGRGVEVRRANPVVVRGRPEVRPEVRPEARVAVARHWDNEAERRQGYFWGRYHPGLFIGGLPVGCVQVSVGTVGYDYYDGVFFQPTPQGSYEVVAPPIGVVVPQLPDGAEAIVVGATTYYYAAGAFYLQGPTGYAVVPAPVGVIVPGLPPGATPATINGRMYYVAGSTYFMPMMQGGVTVYMTARP